MPHPPPPAPRRGFRARFNRWPTRVTMWPGTVEVLRSTLTDAGFQLVE